jgi:hypothetical protein
VTAGIPARRLWSGRGLRRDGWRSGQRRGGVHREWNAFMGGRWMCTAFRQGVDAAVFACRRGRGGPAPAAGAGVARLGRGGGGLPPLKACRVSVIPSPLFLTVSAFDCLATEYGHS